VPVEFPFNVGTVAFALFGSADDGSGAVGLGLGTLESLNQVTNRMPVNDESVHSESLEALFVDSRIVAVHGWA
jgi:hypothetical protein